VTDIAPDDHWVLCATCGVEHQEPLPQTCRICADDRQWVPVDGQRWTTLGALRSAGQLLRWTDREQDRAAVTTDPGVGIGQTMQVVRTTAGTLLWDPAGFIDHDTVTRIKAWGPVRAIASSHPHMFGVQVAWARALDAPVLVAGSDRDWVARADPAIEYWSGTMSLGDVELHQVGGHFPGSAVALWPAGAGGRGVLLSGDTVFPNPDGWSLGFMRSYPNKIPLSAGTVRRVADALDRLSFDSIVGNFDNTIASGGKDSLRRSADRHIAWVNGDFDHLT